MVTLGTGKHWDFFRLSSQSLFLSFLRVLPVSGWRGACIHSFLNRSGQPASQQHKLKAQSVPHARCSCIHSEKKTKDPSKEKRKNEIGVPLEKKRKKKSVSPRACRPFGKRTLGSQSKGRTFRRKRGSNEVIGAATNYFVDLLWFPGNISMRTALGGCVPTAAVQNPNKSSLFECLHTLPTMTKTHAGVSGELCQKGGHLVAAERACLHSLTHRAVGKRFLQQKKLSSTLVPTTLCGVYLCTSLSNFSMKWPMLSGR